MNRNKNKTKGIKTRKSSKTMTSLDWGPRNRLASTFRRMKAVEQKEKE